MKLPSELEQQLREDIYQLEARKAMPYISSYERMAKEEGLQQGLQQAHQSALRMLSQILEHRFGELPSSLTAQLANLSAQQLESLVNRALTARMVDDFATYVATLAASPTADAA